LQSSVALSIKASHQIVREEEAVFYNFAILHPYGICIWVFFVLLWAIFAMKMSIFHGSIWASGVAAHAVFRDQVVVCVAQEMV
jgi:hypothetical protein